MRRFFFALSAVIVSFAVAEGCGGSNDATVQDAGVKSDMAAGNDSGGVASSSSSSSTSSSSSSGAVPGPDSGPDSSAPTDDGGDAGDAGRDDGGDAGSDDSGATLSCAPGTPAPFTFKPAARYQKQCTRSDIDNILNNCVFDGTGATCNAAKAAAPQCASCLIGTPQDATAHPFIIYDSASAPIASTGVCMAAYADDGSSPADCSFAFGEVETCSYESCIPECLDADETTFQDCLGGSISTVCTTGAAVFSSTKCQAEYDGTKYGYCVNSNLPDGGTLSNGDYYALLSMLVCGPPPADAGDGG